MGKNRTRVLTFSEFAVVVGVVGILASIAIPSYVRMKSHARFENLMESVRSCQEEMPHWLRTSVPDRGAESEAGTDSKGLGAKVVIADEQRITAQDGEGTKGIHNVQTGRQGSSPYNR